MSPSIRRTRISAAPTVREPLPAGLIGAVLLHAAIIVATLFTWSHKLDIADETPPVVPVDLVTIGQKTNIAPMVKELPKAPPKEETQPPAPVPTPAPQPAPQETVEAPPPPETEKPEPVLKKPPPPPVEQKQKPQQAPSKKPSTDEQLAALLNKLAAPPASVPKNAKVGDRTIKGIGAQSAMTMDLVDALRNQIQPCWTPPVGAPNPEELVVDFDLFLNPDGSVARPPQLVASSGSASSPYTRAAAEAAKRAIYECAPYKLPQDKYALWHEINPFHFDPRQWLNQ